MKKQFFLHLLCLLFSFGIFEKNSYASEIVNETPQELKIFYSYAIPPFIFNTIQGSTEGSIVSSLKQLLKSKYILNFTKIDPQNIQVSNNTPQVYIGTSLSVDKNSLSKVFTLNTLSLTLFYNTSIHKENELLLISTFEDISIGFVDLGLPTKILLEYYPNLKIKEYKSLELLQEAIQDNTISAYILPEETMQQEVRDKKNWKAFPTPLVYLGMNLYVSKENMPLLNELSTILTGKLLDRTTNKYTSSYIFIIIVAFFILSLSMLYYIKKHKNKNALPFPALENKMPTQGIELEYFFCTLTHSGEIQEISQEVQNILGYTPHKLLGSPIQQFQKVDTNTEDTIDFTIKSVKELSLLDIDGVTKRISLYPIKTIVGEKSENLYEYIAFDISNRVLQQESTLSYLVLYKTFFSHAPIGIIRTTSDGKLIHYNTAFEKMISQNAIELKNKNISIFTIFSNIKQLFQTLQSHHSVQDVIISIPQSSEASIKSFMAYANVQPVKTPEEKEYIDIFMVDITETIIAKKNAEEASEHLRTIINFLPDPTFILDNHKRIIVWNKALEKLTGISAQVMLGKTDGSYSLPFYGYIRPMACDTFFDEKYNTQENGANNTITVEAFCPALGAGKYLWISANVLLSQDSAPIAVIQTMQDITKQKAEVLELEQSKKKYTMVLEASNEGIWEWSAITQEIYASSQCYQVLGITDKEKLSVKILLDMVLAEDVENMSNKITLLTSGKLTRIDLIFRIYRKDTGQVRWIQGSAATDKDISGNITIIAGSLLDITERKEHENITRIIFLISNAVNIRRDPKELFQSIHTILMQYVGYKTLHVALWNEAEQVMEYPYYFDEIYTKDELYTSGNTIENSPMPISKAFKTGVQIIVEDTVLIDGKEQECVWLSTPLRVRNNIIGVIATHKLQNTTKALEIFSTKDKELMTAIGEQIAIAIERYHNEEQLTAMALHDPLTGLPNRVLMSDRLEHAIRRVSRSSEYRFAVFMMDLDRFKLINDTYGHNTGDELLIEVANRIKPLLRSEDTFARLGGDEFAVILENVHSTHEVLAIAKRILRSIEQPLLIDGKELRTATSIGIVIDASTYSSAHTLLRDADIAMYDAKTNGKGRFRVFDQAMHQQMLEYVSLENDLTVSIEQEQLYLDYQPIVDSITHELLGFEALVRWKHPERGIISPINFIAIAEENGFIMALGAWVLEKACSTMKKWTDLVPEASKLTISVNLSAKQAVQTNLTATIKDVLARTHLDPLQLKLEVTETTIMSDPKNAMKSFKELRDLGIQLAIDDFGSGYSSMTYLQKFPVDTLKIDRTFIVNATSVEEGGIEIVRAICALAHSLGLDVVAEGVETQEQLDIVVECKCNATQGYFFSKPLGEEMALKYLQEHSIVRKKRT